MQKKTAIILILVLLIFVCTLTVVKILSRIPENDSDIVGNTAGNLINGGLFCEDDGVIYFANVGDNNYLYSMNSDGSDVKLLYEAPISYINSAGKYLYFYQESNKQNGAFGSFVRTNGIYRLKKDARQSAYCLDRTPSKVLVLTGNDLYYEHYNTSEGITLYKVSTKGGDRKMVYEQDINPACVFEENIFFSDENNNFYLSCYNTDRQEAYAISSDMKTYNLQYDDGYFYFMNVSDDYKLYKYRIGDNSITKLTDCRVDTFNVHNGTIFYQRNGKDAALVRMQSDGSSATVIAEGNYKNISLTENFAFFRAFDNDDVYMVCPLNGAPTVQTVH